MSTFTATSTASTAPRKYDWITYELLVWVREVPLKSDAVANIPRIMKDYIKRYEAKKTVWQRLKELLNTDL